MIDRIKKNSLSVISSSLFEKLSIYKYLLRITTFRSRLSSYLSLFESNFESKYRMRCFWIKDFLFRFFFFEFLQLDYTFETISIDLFYSGWFRGC